MKAETEFSFEVYMPLFKALKSGSIQSITLERKGEVTHVKCDYDTFYLSFETGEMLVQPSLLEKAISYNIDFSKMRNVSIEIKKEKEDAVH